MSVESICRFLRVPRLRNWFLYNVPEGDILPWGHGVAYTDYRRRLAITAPMPFHFVIGLVRMAFIWARFVMTNIPNPPRDSQ